MTGSYSVIPIPPEETHQWITRKHYAKRMPQITNSFGLYNGTDIVGVVTYGFPASPQVKRGICSNLHQVYELNRLVIEDGGQNRASRLVAASLKLMPRPCIVVSYADSAMGHVGYIYQATNWIYTGSQSAHDCEYIVGGKSIHARTLTGKISNPKEWAKKNNIQTVPIKPKHRYLYYLGTNKQIRQMKHDTAYKSQPYPKGDTTRYDASYTPEKQGVMFL